MAVQGSLASMSLPNIVQNICLDQSKTLLVLRRQLEEGAIFFNDGEIIHAKVGHLEGEEAVYSLLSWTEATFRISGYKTNPRRTVNTPWNYLLMEGQRQIDEQSVEGKAQQPLSPVEIEQDETLEDDLFVLLSSLEQMQDRLKKSQNRPAVALQILADLVNEIASFSEAWLDTQKYADPLARALTKASDVYSSARMLQAHNNKLSIEVVLKLHSSWNKDAAGRRKIFYQISHSMLDISKTYFSLLISCFHSSSVAEQSREICDIFLADLTRTVDNIRF